MLVLARVEFFDCTSSKELKDWVIQVDGSRNNDRSLMSSIETAKSFGAA